MATKPAGWKKPRRIFVVSMGDLFYEAVPDESIAYVFSIMHGLPRHTFQLLTKRPKRMAEWAAGFEHSAHIWAGVTCENQEQFDKRVPWLKKTGASVRFVSAEPMLGPISILRNVVDWVICGGESGNPYRKTNPDWVRNLRDDCVSVDVPFFFKKWHPLFSCGEFDNTICGGRLLDGREWRQVPEVKNASA